MGQPITAPGWYRLGPKGLEYAAGLDELPDDPGGQPHITELVRVEIEGYQAEEPLW